MQVHPESAPREKTIRRSVESVSLRNREIVVLFLAAFRSSVSHLRLPVDHVPTRKERMPPRSEPRLPAVEKRYLSFRRTSIHIQGIFQGVDSCAQLSEVMEVTLMVFPVRVPTTRARWPASFLIEPRLPSRR